MGVALLQPDDERYREWQRARQKEREREEQRLRDQADAKARVERAKVLDNAEETLKNKYKPFCEKWCIDPSAPLGEAEAELLEASFVATVQLNNEEREVLRRVISLGRPGPRMREGLEEKIRRRGEAVMVKLAQLWKTQ